VLSLGRPSGAQATVAVPSGSALCSSCSQKAGVLAQATQLAPSSAGKRLRFQDNRLTVLDGPFSESNELIGGFSIMELLSLEEAVEVARRYAPILGGTLEVDLRPLETDG
jgi:hypothetical protein